MQLTTKHYYDDETFEHVASKFYIDSEECDFETYQDFVGGLSEYNEDEIDELKENPYEYDDNCQCQCEICNDYDNCCESGECNYKDECCGECDEVVEEFDYSELLEVYAQRIQETKGNKTYIKKILDEFADIFIPDYEEDEIEEFCEDDECSGCIYNKEDIPDELLEEIKMIEFFADKIENINCDCEACLRNVLYELYCVGKNIGYGDYKDYMKKVIEEVLEE